MEKNEQLGKKAQKVETKEFDPNLPVIKVKNTFEMAEFNDEFIIEDSNGEQQVIRIKTNEAKIRSVFQQKELRTQQLVELIRLSRENGLTNDKSGYELKMQYVGFALYLCDEETVEFLDKMPINVGREIAEEIYRRCDNFLFMQ